VRFLAYLRDGASDPLRRLVEQAPEDDEPLTAEEEEAERAGQEAYLRGDYLTAERCLSRAA
jgi:hypothetical protein